MDHLKTFLKQLVKQRFWIAVAFAMLVPLGVYFGVSGSIKAATAQKIGEITQANTGAQEYASGDKPTSVHAEIVNEDQGRLKAEVTKTWRTLYQRQAPLLTWPKAVEADIPAWGERVWPTSVDASRVQQTITNYVETYNDYVDQVYQSFQPFNPLDGTGIVAAPPKETFLLAPVFEVARTPPTLKQIWDAQERLWLQRAVLDVIAVVNKKANATDWASAIIKQVTRLEVASPNAMDQVTATKGTELKETPEIYPDGVAPPEADVTGGMAKMMPSMGMNMGAAPGVAGAGISYMEGAGGRYRLFPITLGVLIEQDHIQDLLASLQNSPMMIQVKEIQWSRPESQVVKPVKDETGTLGMYAQYAGQMNMGMMGMASGRGRMTFAAPGNMVGAMNRMMPTGMSMASGMGMMGVPGGMGVAPAAKSGISRRDQLPNKKLDELAKKEKDELAKAPKPEVFNPYINVVQLTVYGQARFYNNPDAIVEAPSPGAAPAAPKAKAKVVPGAPVPD